MPERELGRLERLCRERNARDLELARGGHPKGFRFDQAAGDFAVRWIEKFCRHHKGEWAGRPLVLEEWQRENVRQIFGWKRADGSRRFRHAWWETPRKNGKTEVAAGIGAFLLIADNEPGAEVYWTATKKEQALIGHTATREMVRASAELRRHVKVPKATHANLVCDQLGSKMQILAADYGTLDGLSPHGDLRDEVHAWTDHELAGVLSTAMGARRQPLTLEVTTAGVYDAEGVGWQHHDYAVQVLERAFEDDRQFVYIAAIDEADDPWNPATWAKANPNLGISLKPDFIEEQAAEAQHNPRKVNEFLKLHCNRWVQQVTRWLNVERWNACDLTPLDLAALEKVPCWGGLDLSRTTDITAFVLVFQLPDGAIGLLPRFWLPQARLDDEAQKKGQRRLRDWAERGFIDLTPGDVVDYGFVRNHVIEASKRFKGLREVCFDPYNANQVTAELAAAGIPMVEIRQGPPTLSAACKFFEGAILEKRVRHQGNPVLSWMVGNAVSKTDSNGNIAPDKKRAKDKIDGVSATVTALTRMIVAAPKKDPYESRGFLSL